MADLKQQIENLASKMENLLRTMESLRRDAAPIKDFPASVPVTAVAAKVLSKKKIGKKTTTKKK